MLPQFPVIVGPTAGGKSDLALRICRALADDRRLAGEIVSADSMQIYRGLDVGTSKPTAQQRSIVPHHLIDIVDPVEEFSVDQWLAHADRSIDEVRRRSAVPIVVGGTNLYVQSLLFGLFDGPAASASLRDELASRPRTELREELERVDPAAAERIHHSDLRRTIRALEVHRTTGSRLSDLQREWEQQAPRADALLIGIEWPTAQINARINSRVGRMIDCGLVDEARALWSEGRLGRQAREAIGYKQLIEHFEGERTLQDAVEQIKIETRRFAKNQRTWLRRFRAIADSIWLDGPRQSSDDHESHSEVARLVERIGSGNPATE